MEIGGKYRDEVNVWGERERERGRKRERRGRRRRPTDGERERQAGKLRESGTEERAGER